MSDLLVVEGLTRVFGAGRTAVRAVDDVSFATAAGEVTLVMGPFQAQLMERLLSNADLPENVRPLVETLRQSTGLNVVGFLVGAFFTLVVGIVFSTLGGLLGAALFRTKLPPVPPMPPPESPGFTGS